MGERGLIKKGKKMTNEIKAKALADYLKIPVEKVKVSEYDTFQTPDGEFTVMTEDEADDALYDDVENLIYDLGIEGFSEDFRDWIIENALDQSWFEEAEHESNLYYAEDIKLEDDDEYGNRLNQECVEAGIISEDDIVDGEYVGDLELVDELADYMTEENRKYYRGDWVQWDADNFGWDDIKHLIRQGTVDLDIKAIADEVKDWDGYGNNLASWDGKTVELGNDLYAFKQDDTDNSDEE